MRFTKHIFFSAIIGLTACQNGDDTPKTNAAKPAADFTLRATSDIQTPSPIKAATFVPNSVATWLGHIILLDETGTLHRATTDSAETDVVALGKYADVMGLAREKKSGVFLALTPQGQIKAFVQSDDEGNFSPLAVSQGDQSFERFCATATPNGSEIWARTTSRISQKLAVEIFEETSVTLNPIGMADGDTDPCAANNALSLNDDYTVKPDSASAHLTLSNGKKDLSVEITNGLSIGGINDAGFVTVTNTNMGSVFNEGVIVIADENEGRLVLISLAYALRELEAR